MNRFLLLSAGPGPGHRPGPALACLMGLCVAIGCSEEDRGRASAGLGDPPANDQEVECVANADCPIISVWEASCDGDVLRTPTEDGRLGCVSGECNPGFSVVETDCAAQGERCGPDPSPEGAGDACFALEDPAERHDDETLTLEVMVGTDAAMGAAYGDGLGAYVADVMNQAHDMFQKLGPQVDLNVVMVRHEADVDLRGVELSTDSDELLGSWTRWAEEQNVDDDEDPGHFDYSLLLTKTAFGTGWARTGVRICHPGAGSIVFDKGYISAKVITHETGHSFGLGHVAGRENIMHANPGTGWQADSRRFFQDISVETDPCLADFVRRPDYSGVPVISVADQCRTTFDEPVCQLWDSTTQCEKLICEIDQWNCNWDDSPVLDGSSCGEGMWCIGGACLERAPG